MKKLLLITYYWPPSGGVGVQRWLKFVKYLPQFGWDATVVTTQNGDYPAIDESLLSQVSENVTVVRTKTPTFSGIYKKFSKDTIPYGSLETDPKDSKIKKILIWIRLNLLIPDARKIWNSHAYKASRKQILTDRFDAVVTTGPPHSTHLIGVRLKKNYNINWVVDLRDPWTQMGYLKNVKRVKLSNCIDKFLEKQVVSKCDSIVAASQKIIEDLPCASDKVNLITNGFDPEIFKNSADITKTEEFNINYFGSLPPESNPISVLKALQKLNSKGITDIKMNFWGNISAKIKEQLINADKDNIVTFYKYVPHKEAIRLMLNSSMLLLMINNVENNEGIITAKIFEYIGSKVSVLGVGPIDSEPAKILSETASGKMYYYDDVSGIADHVKKIYSLWQDGKISRSNKAEKYSCIELTKELDDILS